MKSKGKRYIVVANMPACSAVLFVNPKLEPAHQVTILVEDTASFCIAYAAGYRAASGLPTVEFRGYIELPVGNPAASYAKSQG